MLFESFIGHDPGATPFATWTFSGVDNPGPGNENPRINLWLIDGTPPTDGQEVEVVVSDFQFLPSCDLELSFPNQTLRVDFELATSEASTWDVSMVAFGQWIPLWSIPLPALDPALPLSVSVPGLPALGETGILSTLTTSDGIVCSDWGSVYTGSPGASEAGVAEIQKLFEQVEARLRESLRGSRK